MQTVKTISALRAELAPWRVKGERIAFVPTMGNLHAGHLKLVEIAKKQAKRVVVSIFVNPLQFGQKEDFASYSRTFEEDSSILSENSVDVLFAPEPEEIYPESLATLTRVEVPGLSDILCGASRPGHFRGVAMVVNKLFNIVQPDLAVFGEKDYQQLLIIRRMVKDLAMPVEIVGVPTVREPDGLALSSRNGYLSAEERRQAPQLYQALCAVRYQLMKGKGCDLAAAEEVGLVWLRNAGLRPDYLSVRRAQDLGPAGADDRNVVILAAAWLGTTRLIDNLQVTLQGDPQS
ncbi:MAG: pantoate--beta-alanine ligase [Gammaproteobacteria bacterium]|nr:pantoate--beta-alanine ligase [Gammaproteobacteria bacterium]